MKVSLSDLSFPEKTSSYLIKPYSREKAPLTMFSKLTFNVISIEYVSSGANGRRRSLTALTLSYSRIRSSIWALRPTSLKEASTSHAGVLPQFLTLTCAPVITECLAPIRPAGIDLSNPVSWRTTQARSAFTTAWALAKAALAARLVIMACQISMTRPTNAPKTPQIVAFK